jgi:hypothetical protein
MKPSPEEIKDEIAALKHLRRDVARKDKTDILAPAFLFQFDIQIHVLENGLTESQAYEHFQDSVSFGSAKDACCWLSGEEPTPLSKIWAVIFVAPA